MAGRDDGEFELILGNKQLLSVLFIVIVLLGVFFAMGFLAGRSTGGAIVTQNRTSEKPPLSVEAATAKDSAEPALPDRGSAKADEPSAAADDPGVAPKQEAVRQTPAPPSPKAAEPEKPAPPKAEPPRKEAPKPEPAKPAPAAGSVVATPPAGTYLQAAATRRADAESMLAFIGGKTGLRGYVAPSPKSPELFRVLIGPLNTNEAVAGARTKMADIGIKSPYPVKY